jgi:uncharacterized membrane protein HdeD (DUF308 family)
MNNQPIDDKNIDIYKWIKIVQSVILMILGIIFIVTAWFSTTPAGSALSIGLGVVFAVYGTIDVISGYLLHRTPINEEVVFGLLMIAFSVILFYRTELLQEVFSVFLIALALGVGAVFIVYGVDRCIGKGTKKSVLFGVLSFVGAALLFTLGGVYIYYYLNDKENVEKWMIIIVGGVILVVGIVSLVMLLIKIKNTREALKEAELSKAPANNTSSEVINNDVRVLDISDLKKHNRKVHNKETAIEDSKEKDDKPSDAKPTDDDPKKDDGNGTSGTDAAPKDK